MAEITPTHKLSPGEMPSTDRLTVISSKIDLWADFVDGQAYSRDLVAFVFNITSHDGEPPLPETTQRVVLADGRIIFILEEGT